MPNWSDINYLKAGDARQQKAFEVLTRHAIMQHLADFDPLLAGTIPIGIYLPESDLDIVCYMVDREAFKKTLIDHFSHFPGFQLKEKEIRGEDTLICRFSPEDFPVEIFGQQKPSEQQFAYRHMLVEHRLLELGGKALRQQILALKKAGLKTEPAFAHCLGLEGDAYFALLQIENWTEEALMQLLKENFL